MNKPITMKFKKGIFSKVIVAVCIAEMAVVQAWGMWIADKDLYDTAGLVAANHAVFGGELLMLCLKRIFAKDRSNDDGNTKEDTEKIVEP